MKEALVSSSHLPSVHMATVAKIARQGILPVRGKSEKENRYMEMHPPRSLHTIFVICSLYIHPTSVHVFFCKGSIELVCVFGGLGIKYKTLCLLGKHSTDKL